MAKRTDERSWGKTLAIMASIYLIGNTPDFIRTYTLPQDRIRPSLSEQLKCEIEPLEDISGGSVFANFRLAGICAGYIARRISEYSARPSPTL